MDIIVLVQYGTPVVLLGLIISNVWLTTTVRDLKESVKDIQAGVVWNTEYTAHRTGMEARVKRLEGQINGK